MGVREKVEVAFRELLSKQPYSKITVAAICESAGIARKTFYSYFDSKEDIISFIFDRDIMKPQRDLDQLLPRGSAEQFTDVFQEKFYSSFLKDKDFYMRIVGPLRSEDSAFVRVAIKKIYSMNCTILTNGHFFDSDWQTDYAAYYIAAAQAKFVEKWISEGMRIPPSDMADLYKRIALDFWRHPEH